MNVQIFEDLANIIASRRATPSDESYTSSLLKAGENKLVKKLGEENAEFIRAIISGSDEEVAGEAADIIYHLMVSLEHRNVPFEMVVDTLTKRFKK
ncbi:MAG: phosphoribosyl-ATP diphosphatase [Deferribacteraceae bacterium]|jgi:phosphoribosyl-ATP pyrophosphohydrolase/phosphoribosyl-ATP pyrophosphohydrolase/phosphoribosyl-AMP cyclohydrolase|nr:phosphoribosyl-ATP diphosphatase [Deferribacteraceae bacterium]